MKARTFSFTQQELKTALHYNPETGKFTDKRQIPPEPVGKDVCGYIRINLFGTYWLAHRLAYFYMTGTEPDDIDHINRNKIDNRWENLRSISRSLNCLNIEPKVSNTSGYNGVTYHCRRKRWQSRICINRKSIYLGLFNCPTAAFVARKRKELEIWKKLAR